MSRPLIGVTMDSGHKPGRYQLPVAYAAAIEKAGGMPFLIGYHTDLGLIPEILDRIAGIVFSGGDDLDPGAFGQALHANAVPLDPARERFERALLPYVESRRLPVLGICLGCQLLNVYRGGSLFQFLPDVPRTPGIEHRKLTDVEPRHVVQLESGCRLAEWLGKRQVMANSSHKQAIDKLGRGLRCTGRSDDGVIEVIEDPSYPLFLGVQWHPERLHDEEDHLRLFQLLVAKSSED